MYKISTAILLLFWCTLVWSQPPGQDEILAWLDTAYSFGTRDTARSETVWQGGKGRPALIAIVQDTSLKFKHRFLASDILFERDPKYPDGVDKKMLGRLYAEALSMPVAGAESWGRPFERNQYGALGKDFIRIGEDAVPALAGLLNNNKELFYGGSDKNWEAPNSYELRVKDFAAFYICKIKHWRYRCAHSRKTRDRKIEKLKRRLKID